MANALGSRKIQYPGRNTERIFCPSRAEELKKFFRKADKRSADTTSDVLKVPTSVGLKMPASDPAVVTSKSL
jgi:hypothetical protein